MKIQASYLIIGGLLVLAIGYYISKQTAAAVKAASGPSADSLYEALKGD